MLRRNVVNAALSCERYVYLFAFMPVVGYRCKDKRRVMNLDVLVINSER